MKKNKVYLEPDKSEFYKIDRHKPIAAEGCKSVLPWVLFFMSLFFCAILAFIVIVNKNNGSYAEDASTYKIFYILCGVLLGASSILLVAYLVRNCLVRNKILHCDITRATITSLVVEKHTTRDKDGDTHTKESVSLSYCFYDKTGNLRNESFNKTYGCAPDFYEGQQLVVAFDETKCFILSKYTLLNESDETATELPKAEERFFSGKPVIIDTDDYIPLGYDKRYYLYAAIYLAFALIFAALVTYYAITVKDVYVWAYVCMFGPFLACRLCTSPSPRDVEESRMPSSA